MDYNLSSVFILLFMMELLVVDARTSTVKRIGHKKQPKLPCVGGKWVRVGSFRFWQRVSCPSGRKQGGLLSPGGGGGVPTPPPGYTSPKPAFDPDDLPSKEKGPARGDDYNPTYGYEPYWADGGWVFDKRPMGKTDAKYMCGTRCSTVYADYGRICARNQDYNYQSFENYCALRNDDCGDVKKWMILYRGECYRALRIYSRHYIHTRTRQYINELLNSHTNLQDYVGFCSKGPSRYAKKKK